MWGPDIGWPARSLVGLAALAEWNAAWPPGHSSMLYLLSILKSTVFKGRHTYVHSTLYISLKTPDSPDNVQARSWRVAPGRGHSSPTPARHRKSCFRSLAPAPATEHFWSSALLSPYSLWTSWFLKSSVRAGPQQTFELLPLKGQRSLFLVSFEWLSKVRTITFVFPLKFKGLSK